VTSNSSIVEAETDARREGDWPRFGDAVRNKIAARNDESY